MRDDDQLVACRHQVTGAVATFGPTAAEAWRKHGWVPLSELAAASDDDRQPPTPRRRRATQRKVPNHD